MPTRNVVLTEHQEQLIASLVASGQYQNASEVLRESLRLMESRMSEEAAKLAWLKAEVQKGIDDIEAGRYTTLNTKQELETFLGDIADRAIYPEKYL